MSFNNSGHHDVVEYNTLDKNGVFMLTVLFASHAIVHVCTAILVRYMYIQFKWLSACIFMFFRCFGTRAGTGSLGGFRGGAGGLGGEGTAPSDTESLNKADIYFTVILVANPKSTHYFSVSSLNWLSRSRKVLLGW